MVVGLHFVLEAAVLTDGGSCALPLVQPHEFNRVARGAATCRVKHKGEIRSIVHGAARARATNAISFPVSVGSAIANAPPSHIETAASTSITGTFAMSSCALLMCLLIGKAICVPQESEGATGCSRCVEFGRQQLECKLPVMFGRVVFCKAGAPCHNIARGSRHRCSSRRGSAVLEILTLWASIAAAPDIERQQTASEDRDGLRANETRRRACIIKNLQSGAISR